jgi:hypothetical protein
MLDWWQKREVERKLAQELNDAQEQFRQANLALRDLTSFCPSGIPAPDSNFRLEQVRRGRVHAYDEWKVALDRWTNFVKYGTVPEELDPKVAGSTSDGGASGS